MLLSFFLLNFFSDEDWREWYDCVSTSYQRKSMGLGSSKCTPGLQKWETRLYYCYTETSYVSSHWLIETLQLGWSKDILFKTFIYKSLSCGENSSPVLPILPLKALSPYGASAGKMLVLWLVMRILTMPAYPLTSLSVLPLHGTWNNALLGLGTCLMLFCSSFLCG